MFDIGCVFGAFEVSGFGGAISCLFENPRSAGLKKL